MNPILILDTETTGLDPAKDELCEVAWALWDPELRTLIEAGSRLVRFDGTPPEMVGIPPGARKFAMPRDFVLHSIETMYFPDVPIVAVAHNAAFDKQWLPFSRPVTWVCSMEDIEWPRRSNSRSLTALALAHGVGVTWAHRALADVMTLVQVFERACEKAWLSDLECTDGREIPLWDPVEQIERAQRPKANYSALVSYDNRQLAKDAGFQWDAPRKQWRRSLFKDKADSLPFKVCEVS